MSFALHNLIAMTMSLLMLAAPVLCMCPTTAIAAPEKSTHACCAQAQPEQQPQDGRHQHSETCTHCGSKQMQSLADHPVNPGDLMPVAVMPAILEPQLASFSQQYSPILQAALPQTTPVCLHTCSLT